MAITQYQPHRRLLEPGLEMPPTNPNKTIGSYTSEANFDSNMVIVLAALLCALICALGLNSIVRCAIRCSYRFAFETPEQATPHLATTTGLKRSALNHIPVMVYGLAGLNFPVTDCPICLGEFTQGEKVRILPKCNHGFHVKCIDKWLVSQSSCPLCRQALLDHPTSYRAEEANVRIRLMETGQYSSIGNEGHGYKNLPGGSLGFPIIGETLSFIRANKEDRGPEWLNERISKYGQVFKTSLMGSPAVIIIGQAGNKFILGAGEDVFAANQPITIQTIGGKNNIFELSGSRYKLVKGAMMRFLKPESLRNYINQMDDLVKTMILKETKEKDTIKAVVTMKKLTFYIACNILFGIKDDFTRDALFDDFSIAFKAIWSLPMNFPGTVYWKGLQARTRIVNRILPIMRKRKEELAKGILGPTSDVMTCMLALRDENQEPIPDDVIMDNFVTLMIASHDTSAILLSLMIWKLARDNEIYNKVLEEQMEIIKRREGTEDRLTWAEIQNMNYTWRVAQEMMRITPPVFGSFRKAVKDTTYAGYDIPKGWQVFWVAFGTHMNTEIFDNPVEFDPSRFENPSKPIPPYAYIPFGGGIHTCVGNEFAKVETLTIIHNLVKMFEWSQVHPEEVITRQPMPYPSMGLPIKLKPRNPS